MYTHNTPPPSIGNLDTALRVGDGDGLSAKVGLYLPFCGVDLCHRIPTLLPFLVPGVNHTSSFTHLVVVACCQIVGGEGGVGTKP